MDGYGYIGVIILLCSSSKLQAQFNPVSGDPRTKQQAQRKPQDDSLQHRTGLEDSISITFRYFDATRSQSLDESINDFTKRFPIPAQHIYLGNIGSASRSILFSPIMQAGWDAGFHTYDIYKHTVEGTRFYNASRPYTHLGYMTGSGTEQIINVLHTQNFKPNWNVAFDFRLISSPGIFKSQKNTHSSITINSFFQSRNKRYSAYFIYITNKIGAGENGGITNNAFLNDARYSSRELIPTRLGGDAAFSSNFFTSDITTGAVQKTSNFLYRHQYDLGQKDSLRINDSTTIKLFYARLRFQHTFQYNTYSYAFVDKAADSVIYHDYFQQTFPKGSSIAFKDTWKEVSNEFSILTYPDKKNQSQFLKLGATLQTLEGGFATGKKDYYNIYALAEYRNKTRNQLWDMEAKGQLYINGLNAGDYQTFASLQRVVSKKLGTLTVGFENINRTPSFIFNPQSSFIHGGLSSTNKENITHIFGVIDNTYIQLQLTGDYYLLSNYTYFDNLYNTQQESSLLNVLRIGASKKIKLSKYIFWYADAYMQQASNIKVVSLPLFFTRNRIAFEGTFFKNLNLSTGVEVKYYTPYKAYAYSPINEQFYIQQNTVVSNRPEGSAFAHLAIKKFKVYVRFENLNTLDFEKSFSFTKNNIAAPFYPNAGLIFRVGINWGFVN